MTSIGIPRQTVARVLNHLERDVTRVYDRYSYDAEKRAALCRWGDELLTVVKRDAADPDRLRAIAIPEDIRAMCS